MFILQNLFILKTIFFYKQFFSVTNSNQNSLAFIVFIIFTFHNLYARLNSFKITFT